MRIVAFVLVLLAGGTPAFADAWGDAKKAFKRELRSEDWKVRRNAYGNLAFFDGAEAVDEVLKAMGNEDNPAVVFGAIHTMGQFVSDEAHARMAAAMLKSKGAKKLYLIMAMAEQKGDVGAGALLEVLHDPKNLPGAAQAALALGRKRASGALDEILPFLRHKDWHLRFAAARGVLAFAGPVPEKPTDPKAKQPPWLPDGFDIPVVTQALVEALEAAVGTERGPMIQALERITKQDFGYDVPAWRAYASGADPAKIRRKPEHPPYFFGLPVWGRKVVIVTTTNVRADKPMPFDRDRTQVVCEVPGARSLVWFKLKTNRQFMDAWILRTVKDMVRVRGIKFDFITMGTEVEPAFGKLTSATPSTEARIAKIIDKLAVEAGNDMHRGAMEALDISGKKDSAAWKKGPDEILYSTCAIPWLAEVTDQEVVGAAIALKAARRMVTIQSVGLDEHPYELMRQVAAASGGTYLSLER